MLNKEVEQQHNKSIEGLRKYVEENGFKMPETSEYKFVAIGYLSIDEDFEKGEVSQNFLTKLRVLWGEGSISGHLGHHTCEFCGNATSNTEKQLVDKENKIKYMFPEMIFHYITEHKFKPSNKFIEFVMRS